MTEVEKKLTALRIAVATDSAGRYTAISDVEPAFCVIRETEEELAALVHDIITSYVKTFHDVDISEFSLESVREETPIPVANIRPQRNFLPNFGGLFGSERTPVAIGC